MRRPLSALVSVPGRVRGIAGTRPRSLVALAGVLGLALVLGLGLGLRGGGGQPPSSEPAAASESPSASASPRVDTTEDATYAEARPGYPDRVVVPALDIDAPVLPISAPDRTLVPPQDPQVLGWWVDGARPGAAKGSALVVGHTVSTGGGALDDLETLASGDEVLVSSRRDGDGSTDGSADSGDEEGVTTAYVVESVEVYRKGTLARRAAELFSQEVDGRLVLLTCEEWDGTRYLSNVVVTAVPVEAGTARG